MRLLISLAVLMCTAFNASAHQLKAAVTTVLFNKNSGHIELMHRYYLHDTEHAVGELIGKHADILQNKADQASFADYAFDRIQLEINHKSLKLENVGFEVDGKFLWVYQETPLVTNVTSIRMRNNVLRDIWAEQMNLVNIEGLGSVRSMHFDGQDDWLEVVIK
ncbi:DUF6702 family protein [Pseudoalteromonas xiamenensis]